MADEQILRLIDLAAVGVIAMLVSTVVALWLNASNTPPPPVSVIKTHLYDENGHSKVTRYHDIELGVTCWNLPDGAACLPTPDINTHICKE